MLHDVWRVGTAARVVPSRYMQAAKAKGPMKADRVSVIVVFSSLLGCFSRYYLRCVNPLRLGLCLAILLHE